MLALRTLWPFTRRLTPAIEHDKIPASVLHPMQSAASCELFSLDPNSRKPTGDTFHGWKVLGSMALKSSATRRTFVDALRVGANEWPEMYAGCFIPRHGLRFKGGESDLDLVICFECASMLAYVGESVCDQVLVSRSPRKLFDGTLMRAGRQLAQPPAG